MAKFRIFATKTFSKWFRKSGLNTKSLLSAVMEMRTGLLDAQLGHGLVKKRVASPGLGKRSAARVIWLKNFSQRLLSLNDHELSMALEAGELHEIKPEII